MAARAPAARLSTLERRLRVRFSDKDLLARALTHRSFAHEQGLEDGHNERLEFLGDAVLELVVADLLYSRKGEAREGVLTADRAATVSTPALAALARRIDLGAHLRLGRGVEQGGGRDLDRLLANALEAVFGAIYLDRGLEDAKRSFRALTREPVARASNFKGQLQEWSQGSGKSVPRYTVVESSGPSHRRHWKVEVSIGGRRLGVGEGSSLRAAEQAAAAIALADVVGTTTSRGVRV